MFGERLKLLRTEKGMTQQDLASLLKVSPSTVGMYEQNRRDPDSTTLKFLADYFDVSLDYLLCRTDIKNFSENTIALHREDGYDEDLPEEAKKEIENFKEFIRAKYGKTNKR